jgi:hypothetical protein
MRRNGRAIAGESLRPAGYRSAAPIYVCVFLLRHKLPLRADHLGFSYNLAGVEFQSGRFMRINANAGCHPNANCASRHCIGSRPTLGNLFVCVLSDAVPTPNGGGHGVLAP